MSLADLGPQYVPDPAGYADLQDRGGVGAWYVERFSHNHVQIQGPALADLVLVLTWIDVWTWLVGNVTGYNTSTFIFNRDETTFLGSYDSEDDALQELQFVLGGIRSQTWQPISTSTTSTILRRQAHPRFGASPHSFPDRSSGAMTSTGLALTPRLLTLTSR